MTARAIALMLAIVGTLADAWTTREGLHAGLREKNPVARWIIARTGKIWCATLVFDAIVIWAMAFALDRLSPPAATVWLAGAGVAQLVVARKNWRLTLRRRRLQQPPRPPRAT